MRSTTGMRIAALCDVHGNLPALEEMRAAGGRQTPGWTEPCRRSGDAVSGSGYG